MKLALLCLMFFFTFPVFAEDSIFAIDSTDTKELALLISKIERQSAIISIEYSRIHLPPDRVYESIWNDEFSVDEYLELAAHIIDATNAIPNDNQDWGNRFRLWRSLLLLSQRCQWSQRNLAKSLEDITQSEIKGVVSKQVENAKAGCDAIDSKLSKYKYDFPWHHDQAESHKKGATPSELPALQPK